MIQALTDLAITILTIIGYAYLAVIFFVVIVTFNIEEEIRVCDLPFIIITCLFWPGIAYRKAFIGFFIWIEDLIDAFWQYPIKKKKQNE